MILQESFVEVEFGLPMIKIELSSFFKKQVQQAVTNILKSKCNDFLNLKKTIISFRNFPEWNQEKKAMVCKDFWITDPYNYGVKCTIFWRSKNSDRIVQLTDNVDNEDLEFWIENPNSYDIFESLIKNTKENMAYRSKFFIEGYPFIVIFEMISINSYLKVYSEEKIDEVFKNKLVSILNDEVDVFNKHNIDNQVGGVIHSISFEELKKNKYVKFYIDFGSSGEEGINKILDIIKNSGHQISKLEIKGL